jgi:hypothetical protein
MSALRKSAAVICVALVAAGCGGDERDYDPASAPPEIDVNDERALAFDCITRVSGIEATLEGEEFIQVGEEPDGPRLEFVQFSGEAEGRQLDGDAEGTEQIGSALLFVNGGSDQLLDELEECLLEVQ